MKIMQTLNKKPSPPPPSPPHTSERIDGYIFFRRLYTGACFLKILKLSRIKVQNVRIGVLGFLTMDNGINTRNDNLRVHTADSNIRTTSVETTARSRWLEWRRHGCPKVMGTTNYI